MRMTVAEPSTDGTYRDRIVAVEPGGNEFIAEADRHGQPSQLFWTWASPNLEFATIFLGVLAVPYFGMTFWQAAAASSSAPASVRWRTSSCRRAGLATVYRRWWWAACPSVTRAMRCPRR